MALCAAHEIDPSLSFFSNLGKIVQEHTAAVIAGAAFDHAPSFRHQRHVMRRFDSLAQQNNEDVAFARQSAIVSKLCQVLFQPIFCIVTPEKRYCRL